MKRFAGFAPAAAWALLILGIGSLPRLSPPIRFPLVDKFGHFGMFAVLGALLAYGLYRARIRASIAWPLVAGIAIGVIDELHQRSVPGRSSDWRDLVADAIGCALGLWLAHRALERRARRLASRAPDPTRASNTIQEHRG